MNRDEFVRSLQMLSANDLVRIATHIRDERHRGDADASADLWYFFHGWEPTVNLLAWPLCMTGRAA
jgi:hypothetical protein